jgi:hypothetical protein
VVDAFDLRQEIVVVFVLEVLLLHASEIASRRLHEVTVLTSYGAPRTSPRFAPNMLQALKPMHQRSHGTATFASLRSLWREALQSERNIASLILVGLSGPMA